MINLDISIKCNNSLLYKMVQLTAIIYIVSEITQIKTQVSLACITTQKIHRRVVSQIFSNIIITFNIGYLN